MPQALAKIAASEQRVTELKTRLKRSNSSQPLSPDPPQASQREKR